MSEIKAQIIAAFQEITEALAAYEIRTDQEVELIVRADETMSLTAGNSPLSGSMPSDTFVEIAAFDSLDQLWPYLMAGEAIGGAA